MRWFILGLVGCVAVSCDIGRLNADVTTGLVGHWELNGNANDETGNHSGIVHGATPTQDRIRNVNGAMLFNGSSDYVAVPDAPDLRPTDAVTFTAWFKPSALNGGWPTVVSKSTVPGVIDGYAFNTHWGSHMGAWVVTNDSSTIDASNPSFATMSLDTWYFAAGVYDGAKMCLYWGHDGQELSVWSKSGSGTMLTSTNALNFGRRRRQPL